jgi:hypothetical protein
MLEAPLVAVVVELMLFPLGLANWRETEKLHLSRPC